MMKRLLVLLLVLALSAVGGLKIAAAQIDSTRLYAVTLDAVTLYAEPNESAEVVSELAANTVVPVIKSNENRTWLQVESPDGEGYGAMDSFLVLDPPLLAQKTTVAADQQAAALFADRDFGSDILTTLDNGAEVTVLGTAGQWAYVMTADGTTGWAVPVPLAPLPEDAALAQVTIDSDNLGVFSEANITSDIATTLENGAVVYIYGAEGEWVQVLAPDGTTGYAVASSFTPLPTVYVDAQGDQALAGIYAEPDFGADVIGQVPNGGMAFFVSDVDDFWMEVYAPGIGQGYALKANFGNLYTTATVEQGPANVRSGPNDNIYPVIATVPRGTKVIVEGKNASGAWIQVTVPFNAIDYPYRGVDGWMSSSLFADNQGNSSLDAGVLAVTE